MNEFQFPVVLVIIFSIIVSLLINNETMIENIMTKTTGN